MLTLNRTLAYLLCLSVLTACAPNPPVISSGHLGANRKPVIAPSHKKNIIPQLKSLPILPPPKPIIKLERYTVVVNLVEVKELLFALARDALLNIDIHPAIKGKVTINAVEQTLPQILARIVKQVDLRYQIEGNNLIITPDSPYIKHYQVDYFNLDRVLDSSINVATQIATTGGSSVANAAGSGGSGNNNSLAQIRNQSENKFWGNLEKSLRAIINSTNGYKADDKVTINSSSGLVTVYGTGKQQKEILKFINLAVGQAKKQVLIEATIVEVQLSDQYQAGVDWQRVAGDLSYSQNLTQGRIGGNNKASYTFSYLNPASAIGNIAATIQLLEKFGHIKVISSPKLMVLNNQPAILKVVNNEVYFTYSSSKTTSAIGSSDAGVAITEQNSTEVHTVPEGLVMSVIPYIGTDDHIILNIRPTISRIIKYQNDPSPELQGTGNAIPVVQVREIESVLSIKSGNVAVMGGLMEDWASQNNEGLPVLSRLPLIGDLFSYRDDQYRKTELIIFLRPTIIKNADINQDLVDYQRYLPDPKQPNKAPNTGITQP